MFHGYAGYAVFCVTVCTPDPYLIRFVFLEPMVLLVYCKQFLVSRKLARMPQGQPLVLENIHLLEATRNTLSRSNGGGSCPQKRIRCCWLGLFGLGAVLLLLLLMATSPCHTSRLLSSIMGPFGDGSNRITIIHDRRSKHCNA